MYDSRAKKTEYKTFIFNCHTGTECQLHLDRAGRCRQGLRDRRAERNRSRPCAADALARAWPMIVMRPMIVVVGASLRASAEMSIRSFIVAGLRARGLLAVAHPASWTILPLLCHKDPPLAADAVAARGGTWRLPTDLEPPRIPRDPTGCSVR